MLRSLDNLLAFIVILTIASLFVTIVVQMFSAALNLRGKNLANALALTFQMIDPSLGEKAHQLATRILTDPLFSDSTLTTKDRMSGLGWIAPHKGPWDFFNLRGAAHLAKAIRAEEVYAVLRGLKDRRENAARAEGELAAAQEDLAEAKTAAAKAAAQVRVSEAKSAAGPKLSFDALALQETATRILQALVTPADRAAAVSRQLGTFLDIADGITDAPTKKKLVAAVEDTSATLVVEIDAARAKFAAWFESSMERAEKWFQTHTGVLTVATSLIVALVLQLDAVDIFRQVSISGAAGNSVVESVNQLLKTTDPLTAPDDTLAKRIAKSLDRPRAIPATD